MPSCDNLFLVGVYRKANKVQSRATFQEHTDLNRMRFLLLLQITLAGQEHEEEEDKKTNQLVFFVPIPFLCCPEKQHKVALFHDSDIKIWEYPFFCGSVGSY
jgi:hypothetical protein